MRVPNGSEGGAQRSANVLQEPLRFGGLREKPFGARSSRGNRRPVGRHREHRDMRRGAIGRQQLHRLAAVEHRHREVHEDQIRRARSRLLHRFRAVARLIDRKAPARQPEFPEFPEVGRIIARAGHAGVGMPIAAP